MPLVEVILGGVILGGLYALVAIGFNLQYGMARIVNLAYGEWDKTLLHFAAERNDEELTRLALSAAPDLGLKDKAYHGTPFDWARHFGHSAIADLIASHKAQ